MKGDAYSHSHPRAQDFSRTREQTGEPPNNYISYGTVGHYDSTPAYARIEDGDVLVEVTLVPAGDEVVARLDLDTVDGGGSYFPVSYGQRVIVGFPNGQNGDPVILGRVSDGSWPFPSSVAGVSTTGQVPAPPGLPQPAPSYAFIKTQDGQLLAIETGDGADVLIHSGAGAQLKAQPSSQVLLTGRTHIGTAADWSQAPVGAQVADSGFVAAGSPGGNYSPAVNTTSTVAGGSPALVPVIIPPPIVNDDLVPLPADGIVRQKDQVEIGIATLENLAWFTWLIGVDGVARGILPALPPLPASFYGVHIDASLNTVSDD